MVSIVVPTYNERENITKLIERIDSSLKSLEGTYEILVVDDNSPDETWKVAIQLSNRYPIRVIRRKNAKGLATAVLKGVEEADYGVIVVLDADLQHPPEKIPELVAEIKKRADIAVASRFVEGGDSGNFSFPRRVISAVANFLVSTLFREVREISDTQSGFFAFRKDVISNSNLDPKGYKILLEIMVLGNYSEVAEVGYKFGQREVGKSKLGIKAILEFLYHILSLSWRAKETSRFVKFCVVGGIGTIVNLTVLYLLTTAGLFYLLSGAIAIEISLLSNFFLNKAWTFRDRGIKGLKLVTIALYRDHMVRFGGLLIKLFFLWFLTDIFGMFYIVSQATGIAVAMLWNFTGNKWWTWEKSI